MSEVTRRPAVYLIVLLPMILGGGVAVYAGMSWLLARVKHTTPADIPEANGLLVLLPSFFLWLPIALWLSNLVILWTPPLRRVAEEFVARSGEPGYEQSQVILAKVIGVMALICLPLIIVGFVL